MKWHNLRVGLTCLASCIVGVSIVCLLNYKFGEWAVGTYIAIAILSSLSGFAGVVHIIGWMAITWEGPKI